MATHKMSSRIVAVLGLLVVGSFILMLPAGVCEEEVCEAVIPAIVTSPLPTAVLSDSHKNIAGAAPAELVVPAVAKSVANNFAEVASEVVAQEATATPPSTGTRQLVTLRYGVDCFDLDTGSLLTERQTGWMPTGSCPRGSDFQVAYNSEYSEPAVLILAAEAIEVGQVPEGERPLPWAEGEEPIWFEESPQRSWQDRSWQGDIVVQTEMGNQFAVRVITSEMPCEPALCLVVEWEPYTEP